MRSIGKFKWGSSAWRWAAALTLAFTLVGVQAASAASSGSATLILFAPGAPLGSEARVEWLDPSTGVWTPVDGWTGTLNQTTGSGVPYQGFPVLPPTYGQQAFRWVVLNPSSAIASTTTSPTGNT